MGIYDVFDDDEPAAAPPAPAAAAASSIYSAAVPSVDLPPRRGPSLREQAGLDPSPRELLPRSLAPAPAQASAPPRTFFELPAISKPPVEEEEEVVVPGGALDLISNMFGPKPAVGKGAGGKASSGARKVSAVTAAASKQPMAASRGSSAAGRTVSKPAHGGSSVAASATAQLDAGVEGEEGEEEEEDEIDEDDEDDDQEEEGIEDEDTPEGGVEEWPKLTSAPPRAPHMPLFLGPRPAGPGATSPATSVIYPPEASVNANVNQYLRSYQREGVQWLWKQYAVDDSECIPECISECIPDLLPDCVPNTGTRVARAGSLRMRWGWARRYRSPPSSQQSWARVPPRRTSGAPSHCPRATAGRYLMPMMASLMASLMAARIASLLASLMASLMATAGHSDGLPDWRACRCSWSCPR